MMLRGRLDMAIFMGGTPLGSPLIGWVGQVLGPRASVLVAALTTGICAAAVLIYYMTRKGLRMRIDRHPMRIRTWMEQPAKAA